ncbi:MAG TPA: SAM-dependent methyltransferase [Verrucomicrobiae bacterium]|jgi:hypothetical protein
MKAVGASFRDPSGCVVEHEGEFLRVVRPAYAENYDFLLKSGLYRVLTAQGLLIPHEEIEQPAAEGVYKVLRPRQVPFISYPYEWCFSQLRDAALATLAIQKAAMAHGMSLKDASAFNIQFVDGRPTLIDTLSFEKLRLRPWAAYGQFCRHFLAPLALIKWRDARMGQLPMIHLDGIPLPLAASLLPHRARLNTWLLMHLFLHAASEKKAAAAPPPPAQSKEFPLRSFLGLTSSLESAVQSLKWQPPKTNWSEYYGSSVLGGRYVAHKLEIVGDFLKAARPGTVWDLGANTGRFSRLAVENGAGVLSFDGDPACVEMNYLEARRERQSRLLPLVMDLTNPSPALGWDHRERMSWLDRPKPDMALALGLTHHLAIGNNVPFDRVADFFARLAPSLVVEFVPKDDPNAKKLLRTREDIFDSYSRADFERAFGRRFAVEDSRPVEDSTRRVYLMRRLE